MPDFEPLPGPVSPVQGGRTVCPDCGTFLPGPERERIEVDVVAKLREADLSVDQLRRLAGALAAADPATAAQDVGDAVPKARKTVAAAQALSPGNWISLLAILVAALVGTAGILVSHSDAEKARVGQDQPVKTKRTSQLTDDDLRKLSERVTVELQRQNASRRPTP